MGIGVGKQNAVFRYEFRNIISRYDIHERGYYEKK